MSEKEEIYRAYVRGKASEDDVREVFDGDFEEVEERRELIELMSETPNKEPSENLFDTPQMSEYLSGNQNADKL